MTAFEGSRQKSLVLFIHGVGGSNDSTWGCFSSLIRSDPLLSTRIDVAFFGYPTAIWRIPFSRIAIRIQDIAQAVRTEILSRYKDYPDILLVCHSMGCTVARKYIIETMRAKQPLTVKGVLLFAEPESGSSLARWADLLSFSHWQMRQLQTRSDFLETIALDWHTFVSSTPLKICEVKGGQDAVLPRRQQSATTLLLADKDHRTIVKPSTTDDSPYVVFRNFVTDTLRLSSNDCLTACLFDIYQPNIEPYYIERREDSFVASTLAMQNIWLFGQSGVGKTATLMRALSRSGAYRIVSLGHYAGADVKTLYCALYESLLDETVRLSSSGLSWPELIVAIVDRLNEIATADKGAILIEEMPLAHPEQLAEFFLKFCQVLSLAAQRFPDRRWTFAFSSISDPRIGFSGGGRIAELLKVKEFFSWKNGSTQRLLDLLLKFTGVKLLPDEVGRLLSTANGSPRFLKVFFRNYLNISAYGPTPSSAFDEAIETTRLEMMPCQKG